MPDESFASEARDTGGWHALWLAMRSVLHAQRSGAPIARADRSMPLPASFGQQRLWFLERLWPGSALHNQTIAYRLAGALSLHALERALGEIVRRHEALRTTLEWSGDRLLQKIHPASPFAIELEDLRVLADDAKARRADEATRAEASTPLDIERAPLLRAKALRLADDEHRLVVTMHHLAFDGWSFDIFMRELCALYTAFADDRPSPLTDPALQYADWAAWQRARLSTEALDPLLAYWTRAMAGSPPVLYMPADRRDERIKPRRGASEPFALPTVLSHALKRLADDCGATPYMLLLAAFQLLLARYSGERDIVVGSPAANRHAAGSESIIGLLVNTLAIRTRVEPDESFGDLVARVRAGVLGAYEHQDLPFERLVEAIGGASRIDTTPLFQAMFAFQNLPRSEWRLPNLSIDAWNVGSGTAKFDLTLFMWERADGYAGVLEYDADRYDGETARQWLRHFRTLLQSIIDDPRAPVAKLPLLDAEERRSLTVGCNAMRVRYPRDTPIHRLFAQRARERPRAIAIANGGETIDYAELDRRSNRFARLLRRRGVARGARVGVCLDRSPSLVVAFLAILKAGGAYVPVDPAWPPVRIAHALRAATAIVTCNRLRDRAAAAGAAIVDVDDDAAIERERDDDLDTDVCGDDLAYVMFTSGSTGEPKGVCVPHRAIVRLVIGANYAALGPDDIFVQLAPAAFDASTFEIWGALLNGATLALAPARLSLDDIADTIAASGATVVFLTTGLFEAMVDARIDALAQLRQLLVGGDVLSVAHAERLLRRAPACRLVNCYGPTENTTFTTFHTVGLADCASGEAIPIGRPVSNTEVHVLDAERQPVPIGVAGEAYIGGDGLMQGYFGDADATRERLVPSPFDETQRLYRSGDIVRRRRDGSLEFVGRNDDQVKIRGYRVEPREVESVLARCEALQRVTVVAERDATQRKRLCAYVVPAARHAGNAIDAVRAFARERLPDYLVPSEIFAVDDLPLGPTGKVDRERLRAMPRDSASRATAVGAPRDDRERRIVRVFERILRADAIGVDDDFFDRGGTSLDALALVAALEDEFDAAIALASLYENPTPATLAQLLASPDSTSDAPALRDADSMLVEIRRGRGTPLFLVPGGHGGMPEMTLYANVMRHVERDVAVYGLLARGVDGRGEPHASVDEMASAYVAEIRRLQPRGPYAIAGECVGGLIALEIAQRLVALHEPIALLLLIDTWCPTLAGVLHYRHVERTRTLLAARAAVARRGAADVRRVFRDHVRDRPPFAPWRSLRYAINVARTLARVAKPWVAAVYAVGKPAAGAERVAAAEANYVERTMRYRPRRYPGAIKLIVCDDNERRGLATPWRALAGGGLDVRTVRGDHDSYLRETPREAAALIDRMLDDAMPVAATEQAIVRAA